MKKKHIKSNSPLVLSGLMVGIFSSLFAVSGIANAWGPERPTYTNENPASQAVFNSITNNAAVGDERDFVRVVEVHDDGTRDNYVNELHVQPGKKYEVYIYYHNDASGTYNDKAHDYVGVARETKISAAFPESIKKGEKGEVNAIISSTTTSIPKVWDEAYLVADDDVVFAYVDASAKIFNDWGVNGRVLSTNLFSADGTYIGLNDLNGLILGCDEYSGQVVFQIQALTPEKPEPEPELHPGFEIDKKVSVDGSEWFDNIDAKPGDTLKFKVTFKNTGEVVEKDVVIKDVLNIDAGMSYVPGSVKIVRNGNENAGEDILFSDGIALGNVNADETVEIIYDVNFAAEKFDCGTTTLYNDASISGKIGDSTEITVVKDSVEIKINRTDGCTPTPTPDEPIPDRIVNTGPVEITMAIVVVLGIIGGGFYLYRTRKTLKTVEKTVSGKAPEAQEAQKTSATTAQKAPEAPKDEESKK